MSLACQNIAGLKMPRIGVARHLCTPHEGHHIFQPARASSDVPCESMTAHLSYYRQVEASARADGAVGLGLLPDEMRDAPPGAVGGGCASLDQEKAATGPAAVMSAGATSPVLAADDLQPSSEPSWLPLANPKTQRTESIGADARAGSNPAETASQPAPPKLAVLASDDIPWTAAKGSSSPGSINNDSIGLGLIHEEEGAETRPSRSRFICGPFKPRAPTGQPARDGANALGYLVTHPTEGDDLDTPTSEAPSTLQTSAAEALQGLRGTGRQAQDQLNLVTGLPSQHGMTTRDPLKSDQAAEMLVQIRETGVREARHAGESDPETSEDSAGSPSARQTPNIVGYIICHCWQCMACSITGLPAVLDVRQYSVRNAGRAAQTRRTWSPAAHNSEPLPARYMERGTSSHSAPPLAEPQRAGTPAAAVGVPQRESEDDWTSAARPASPSEPPSATAPDGKFVTPMRSPPEAAPAKLLRVSNISAREWRVRSVRVLSWDESTCQLC